MQAICYSSMVHSVCGIHVCVVSRYNVSISPLSNICSTNSRLRSLCFFCVIHLLVTGSKYLT